MKITTAQLKTTLDSLIRADDKGVHSFYIAANAGVKNPHKLIEKLEQQGYIFQRKPMVKVGKILGVVYILLEDKPRKQLGYVHTKDEEGRHWSSLIEVNNSAKQEALF